MEKIVIALLSLALFQQPGEYQVKAAFLYNFGKFVNWPPNAPSAKGDSFRVCVLGSDPFGTNLDSILKDEHIDGKKIIARRIDKAQEAADCRILFISTSESSHLKEIFTAVGNTGVLTVSDMPQFVQSGGMIQFVLDGTRVRFEINRRSAIDAGLTLSSELLKVAAAVR